MAEVRELGDLGHELETLYEGLAQSRLAVETTLLDLLHRCHDKLAEMVEALKAGEPLPQGDQLIQAIHDYVADPAGFSLPTLATSTPADPSLRQPRRRPPRPVNPTTMNTATGNPTATRKSWKSSWKNPMNWQRSLTPA